MLTSSPPSLVRPSERLFLRPPYLWLLSSPPSRAASPSSRSLFSSPSLHTQVVVFGKLQTPGRALGNDLLPPLPMHIRQSVVAPLEAIHEPRVIETEQVHPSRLQVMHVNLV